MGVLAVEPSLDFGARERRVESASAIAGRFRGERGLRVVQHGCPKGLTKSDYKLTVWCQVASQSLLRACVCRGQGWSGDKLRGSTVT